MRSCRKKRPGKKGWIVSQKFRVHKKSGEVIATPVTKEKAIRKRPRDGFVTERTEKIIA